MPKDNHWVLDLGINLTAGASKHMSASKAVYTTTAAMQTIRGESSEGQCHFNCDLLVARLSVILCTIDCLISLACLEVLALAFASMGI